MSDVYAFMSPSAVTANGDHRPQLRTPMERAHLAAGATLEPLDGWRIAVYDENGSDPWAADVSHTGKLDVRGSEEQIAELTGGVALGQAREDGGVWTLRLTRTRAIVLCPFGRVAELRERIPGAVDMTCGWAGVAIGGQRWRELFMRCSALDVRQKRFAPGDCMAGSVMRVPTIVLNEDGSRVRMLVGWEFGEYFWEAILDAGETLGIAPLSAAVALALKVMA